MKTIFMWEKKERETTTQQQRCGKKRNPQKSQGTPIKKVTCSTKKIPIIIWYDILRLRSARWILIGSYIDKEILEVLFFFSIETSLQIKFIFHFTIQSCNFLNPTLKILFWTIIVHFSKNVHACHRTVLLENREMIHFDLSWHITSSWKNSLTNFLPKNCCCDDRIKSFF